MSGGGSPKDRSVELAQQQHQYTQEADAKKAASDATALSTWGTQNTGAQNAARASAEDYFRSMGLDPAQYQTQINNYIATKASGVPSLAGNLDTYYGGAGEKVYGDLTTGAQNKATSDLDRLFNPNYASTRVASTVDDPYLAEIDAAQQKQATDYLTNLLTRGVVTQGGYDAGAKAISNQQPGVLAKLNEVGQGAIEKERGGIQDIINRGYSAAGSTKLGQNFNAGDYSSQVDANFNDWLNNLGTTIKGGIGSQPLYDTSGLAAIAGGAQGAGASQVFDPKALAGINEQDTTKKTNDRTAASTGLGF